MLSKAFKKPKYLHFCPCLSFLGVSTKSQLPLSINASLRTFSANNAHLGTLTFLSNFGFRHLLQPTRHHTTVL